MIASTSLLGTSLLVTSPKFPTTFMISEIHQTTKSKTSAATKTTMKRYRYSSNRFVAACLKENVVTNDIPFAVESQLIRFEEALKRIKKRMASKSREDEHVQVLVMIDAIQRLGLENYFQDDIHAALEKYYVRFSTIMAEASDDLHDVALGFRLLRQDGFYVSAADTFNKFKNKDGKFKLELAQDTKGLLSLFEASQLSIPSDDILDEAGDLWSKEIGMDKVMDLARNKPIKWHVWSLNIIPGPYKAELRTELTKSISLIYIIDDLFDVYGKLEELILFTEAVNRWDYANINGLPDYMKLCLKALYDTTNHMSQNMYIKHGWHPKFSLQKAWIDLCNAFLVEAKWVDSEYLPTTEEYLKNGIVSSGVYVVFATLYCLLGEDFDDHISDSVSNNCPDIVTIVATLLRLWDDLGWTKDGNEDDNDGSYVECYMNEHQGSSEKSAREFVFWMISDVWKRLNEECLSESQFSEFNTAFLNLARMIPIMYKDDCNDVQRS